MSKELATDYFSTDAHIQTGLQTEQEILDAMKIVFYSVVEAVAPRITEINNVSVKPFIATMETKEGNHFEKELRAARLLDKHGIDIVPRDIVKREAKAQVALSFG